MSDSTKMPAHEALVLSTIYKELSDAADQASTRLDEISIRNVYNALDRWERTIEWINENEAKKSGIHYFFYTFNRTLYKFVSMAFSNPRIEIPDFALKIKDIIRILIEIDNIYTNILKMAEDDTVTKEKVDAIRGEWTKIYGDFTGKLANGNDSPITRLKDNIEIFLGMLEKKLNPENDPPILNSQKMMPYETSIEVLKMHIPLLDRINDSYWEWEKLAQNWKEKEAQDEAAKFTLLSTTLSKNVKDKLNNFFFLNTPYKPDFIMVGEHGSEKGSVKTSEYENLVSMEQGDIVNMPNNVFGEFYDTLSADMKLVLMKILMISDLSIRRGPYVNSGKMVTDINEPGHLKEVKEQLETADNSDILKTFRMNLKRFFLNITYDPQGNEIAYTGPGTRATGIGQMKMLRRLRYISSSDETKQLFKKVVEDRAEFDKVAEYIKTAEFQIFKFQGKTGGRRRRKTRRRKRKTKKRKKTRRRKRTKKRKKKKKKRRKTKRRRRK